MHRSGNITRNGQIHRRRTSAAILALALALLAAPPDEPVATMWIGLLVSFDVVFVTLALWTFEPLMTE